MDALKTIKRVEATKLAGDAGLRFCFMDANKRPFRADSMFAHPNRPSDFVSLGELGKSKFAKQYAGIGISVQASKVCAIDIDHCLGAKDDFSTMSAEAAEIVSAFEGWAYIESSFSGTGIRILFRQPGAASPDGSLYFTKNSKAGIEYYTYLGSPRYVSVTGRAYRDNPLDCGEDRAADVMAFLEAHMRRPAPKAVTAAPSPATTAECMAKLKRLIIRDQDFQDNWFNPAPGHGHDESERDYRLVLDLYTHITPDGEAILAMVRMSPFYKSKDNAHVRKYERDNFRYYWTQLYGKIAAR